MLQPKERGSFLPTVFSFNEHSPVRTILIEDQPWFTAVDICDILGYKNPREVIRTRLEDDERRRLNLRSDGAANWFINESGLYSLIIGSKKPEARRFRKWITSEVLPTLRKKGFYSMTVAPDLLGLHGVIISGHPYYDYLDLLTRVGLSTTSGSRDQRRRKNPQEFCTLNSRIRVSGNYAGYIMRMNRVRKEQADIRERRIKHFNLLQDQQASGQTLLFEKGGMV
jgi:hypothetical protein